MGGPYCETCNYFCEMALTEDEGECSDPSKIIYAKHGDRINSAPWVRKTNECCNHAQKTDNQPLNPERGKQS